MAQHQALGQAICFVNRTSVAWPSGNAEIPMTDGFTPHKTCVLGHASPTMSRVRTRRTRNENPAPLPCPTNIGHVADDGAGFHVRSPAGQPVEGDRRADGVRAGFTRFSFQGDRPADPVRTRVLAPDGDAHVHAARLWAVQRRPGIDSRPCRRHQPALADRAGAADRNRDVDALRLDQPADWPAMQGSVQDDDLRVRAGAGLGVDTGKRLHRFPRLPRLRRSR